MRERTPFPGELVKRLPNLRLLLTTGTRNKALDLVAFKERGIPVVGADDLPPEGINRTVLSTVEHIVASILAVTRNIATDDASVKNGAWQTQLSGSIWQNIRRGGTLTPGSCSSQNPSYCVWHEGCCMEHESHARGC